MTLAHRGFFKKMSDEKFLKRAFKITMGEKLDLDNPKTFNQKLQWLKIHDRKPEYTRMVDKYEAKNYVKQIDESINVIKTLGVWDKFDDIDFDKLPNKFVLKCTHDSGGIVICKDKNTFDIKKAKKTITKCQKNNYFWGSREWPYKNVKPRIIAEEYMEDVETGELRDYKFFTFDGKVKLLFIATDRQNPNEETKFDFFDENFNHLNIKNGHENSKYVFSIPSSFEKMKSIAEVLGKGIKHLRVDLYDINGKIYFGEITFYHWSGFVPFEPYFWDTKLGNLINIEKS